MARQAGRPNDFITNVHSSVSDLAARQTADRRCRRHRGATNCWPTLVMYITLVAFNGFSVRFSSSVNFWANIWRHIKILWSLVDTAKPCNFVACNLQQVWMALKTHAQLQHFVTVNYTAVIIVISHGRDSCLYTRHICRAVFIYVVTFLSNFDHKK